MDVNTSLALIYQRDYNIKILAIEFKYIYWACLSLNGSMTKWQLWNSNTSLALIYPEKTSSQTVVMEFKYIYWAYLSKNAMRKCSRFLIQIHLLFLFIAKQSAGVLSKKPIQIHLMFLFIPVEIVGRLELSKFKYISYSYLSKCIAWFLNGWCQFKYISCSYLSQPHQQASLSPCIQIHLLFLFISVTEYYVQENK